MTHELVPDETAQCEPLQIWDTASVQKKNRFSYFREAVCKTFLKISPERPQDDFIAAQVKRMPIADSAFTKLSASPHRALREKTDLSQITEEYLSLNLQLTGRNILTTARGQSHRRPGDLTLNYCNQLLSIEILPGEPYSMAGLFFKKSAIDDFIKPNFEIENQSLSTRPLGPALIGCLQSLNRRHLVASSAELKALSDAAISLMVASLLQDDGFIENLSNGQPRLQEGLLSSIKGFIDDNLSDPFLSPGVTAKRFGISTRYLHKLFAPTQQSFGDYLICQRLEQAKMNLNNAAFDHMSIAEIGYCCGFKDLSVFHRNFKMRFDVTPRAVRSTVSKKEHGDDG